MSTTTKARALSVGEKVTVVDDLTGTDHIVCVVDVRHIPAIAGPGGREATDLVRLPDGDWYDLTTGLGQSHPERRILREQV